MFRAQEQVVDQVYLPTTDGSSSRLIIAVRVGSARRLEKVAFPAL